MVRSLKNRTQAMSHSRAVARAALCGRFRLPLSACCPVPSAYCLLLSAFCLLVAPRPASAHPMGNFSISHYAGIRIQKGFIELRYLIDMAEIPTYQEIQQTGILPKVGDPSLSGYLARKAEVLKQGLLLEI